MRISYGITVCNELNELQRLVTFLLKHKRQEDNIMITFDSRNGSKDVEEYLRTHSVNGEFNWNGFDFNGDFSALKNHTIDMLNNIIIQIKSKFSLIFANNFIPKRYK